MPSAVNRKATSEPSSNCELQPPIFSSRDHNWKNILVEEFYQPPGEEVYQNTTEHTLCLSLNRRPFRLSQQIGDRRHVSFVTKGDLSIAPANALMISQWHQDDQYLRIRIASEFLDEVAQHAVNSGSNRIELLPEFRAKNVQIEQIGLMFLAELRNQASSGPLYVESLTNILAIHLLKNYSAISPCLIPCEGGLSSHQLRQVTEYILSHLSGDIQLCDLANLLQLSQFHFSRLFKQSMGISPYQYVLQQRVEHAKQLLKTTNLSVMEIALACGFSSHSHLGKLVRQQTGMTPKELRN